MKPGEFEARAMEIARTVESEEQRTLNYARALAAVVSQHPDGLHISRTAFHSIGPEDFLQTDEDLATGDLILRLVRR